jgi:predicted acylesterase/phospholipase RssA
MISTRAHALVLLLSCTAGGPLLINALSRRSPIAQPGARVGRIHAKLTPIDSYVSMLRLVDEEQLQLGDLDVRGDIGPLRDKTHLVHPVLEALRERAAAGSKPGARADDHKIALAIEGGGMRGAVGAGMVAALHELGLSDAFDVVYGSSAGALVGAYFVSGQLPRFGTSVYYECLGDSGKAFINPVQLVRCVGLGALQLKQWLKSPRALGPPVLNLDYLLIDVMQHDRPLDWERFWARNRDQPLRVLASGLETQRPAVLGSAEQAFSTLDELATCLRASMLLPGITGPPMQLPGSVARGEPLADAVLTEPIPYRAALAEGCTHVLVLRTKADGKRVSKMISLGESLIARYAPARPASRPARAAAESALAGASLTHAAPRATSTGATLGASSSSPRCCVTCCSHGTSGPTPRTSSFSTKAPRAAASTCRLATTWPPTPSKWPAPI